MWITPHRLDESDPRSRRHRLEPFRIPPAAVFRHAKDFVTNQPVVPAHEYVKSSRIPTQHPGDEEIVARDWCCILTTGRTGINTSFDGHASIIKHAQQRSTIALGTGSRWQSCGLPASVGQETRWTAKLRVGHPTRRRAYAGNPPIPPTKQTRTAVRGGLSRRLWSRVRPSIAHVRTPVSARDRATDPRRVSVHHRRHVHRANRHTLSRGRRGGIR